jgi:hypothetical protein
MGWAACLEIVCLVFVTVVVLISIPWPRRRNRRLPDRLPSPSSSCDRNYIP